MYGCRSDKCVFYTPIRGYDSSYWLKYDVWSNIHYGYVGSEIGFYPDELQDFAEALPGIHKLESRQNQHPDWHRPVVQVPQAANRRQYSSSDREPHAGLSKTPVDSEALGVTHSISTFAGIRSTTGATGTLSLRQCDRRFAYELQKWIQATSQSCVHCARYRWWRGRCATRGGCRRRGGTWAAPLRRARGPRASRPARRRRAAPPPLELHAHPDAGTRRDRPASAAIGAVTASMSSSWSSATFTRAITGRLVRRKYPRRRARSSAFKLRAVDRRARLEDGLGPVEGRHLVEQRLVALRRLAALLDLRLHRLEVGVGELELDDGEVLERIGTGPERHRPRTVPARR